MVGCLFFAFMIQNNYHKIYRNIYINLLKKNNLYSSMIIIFCILILSKNWQIQDLLIPPLLPTAKAIEAKINDVTYVYPGNWTARCWDAQLPCSPVPIKGNIQLKDPQKGIRGGFINQNKNE